MSGSILIEDLRNIRQLDFPLPSTGVWILTAGNGAGKTSLLACLRRIGDSNAFPTHFPASLQSDKVDNPSRARIIYRINGEAVEYAYRGERWAPRPRRNSQLLQKFGYPSVVYIGATAERITPRPEDFHPSKVRAASKNVIDVANRIFETRKFDELYTVNLTRGGGNKAYLLRVQSSPALYHSEKHFSLGELCILKLINLLGDCPNQSLILIDELEIALHPKAQVQLYNYLVEIAKQKNLTVIFSTHSVSLLKTVDRRKIIYLNRDESTNNVDVIASCFPTMAIGAITLGEERSPDVVFYVEDEIAELLVRKFIHLVLAHRYQDNNKYFPTVKVLPIGGFNNVVRFMSKQAEILPSTTKQYSVLDHDACGVVAGWSSSQNYKELALFKRFDKNILYLPWTPEVGILAHFSKHHAEVVSTVRLKLLDHQLSWPNDIYDSLQEGTGEAQRKAAKRILNELCAQLAGQTGRSQEAAYDLLCEIFVVDYFQKESSRILELLSPAIA